MRSHAWGTYGDEGSLSHRATSMIVRALLEHAPWYEWPNRAGIADPYDSNDPYGSDRYEKVIFLDIDGVLNDEGPRRSEGIVIDPRMVDVLAHIVWETSAQIVLTSSWRVGYQRFACAGFAAGDRDRHLRDLQEQLDRCDLQVGGMTPDTSLSGSCARPLEIMEWLRRYWQTTSFVILEDDTFWRWGWLRDHVVTTQTPTGRVVWGQPETAKGLTMAHAERAIELLGEASTSES